MGVGEFQVPAIIIDKGITDWFFSELEDGIKNDYKFNEFFELIKSKVNMPPNNAEEYKALFSPLYYKINELEKDGKDKIWCNILKNAFAPIFSGKFDYVIGNPPWVNWENLPEDYRNSARSI
ncbi:MAG: Eco57I restriction-modification methylase domain-containing protein [Methanosarcinales archaeon]